MQYIEENFKYSYSGHFPLLVIYKKITNTDKNVSTGIIYNVKNINVI